MVRMGWALAFWNARKTIFVLRGRRGQCPCHNPSDSGRPLETGCEAVLQWRQPQRFRVVCPLLAAKPGGGWVCSVAAGGVRPFWGRALGLAAATVAVAVILAAGGVFGTMRAIGYQVSLRQVIWPPAWRELRAVRAQLFVDQSREHYQAGRLREAVSALLTAHEVAPNDYRISMTLAQVAQAGSPSAADGIYVQMMKQHPEMHADTARVWFVSLLGRGRLADVAALARRELSASPAQAEVWTDALIFAARHLRQPELLESASAAPGVPAAAAAVLRLEARARQAPRATVPAMLLAEPVPENFPYALTHRAELLVEFDRPREALAVLAQAQRVCSGRDIARLALTAYVADNDPATLVRETDSLLSPLKNPGLAEITLLSQHLVRFPNKAVLDRVAGLLEGRPNLLPDNRREAWFSVLCAAGAAGDRPVFARLKGKAVADGLLTPAAADRLADFFFGPGTGKRVESILPMAEPMTVYLMYALLDRYWTPEPEKRGG